MLCVNPRNRPNHTSIDLRMKMCEGLSFFYLEQKRRESNVSFDHAWNEEHVGRLAFDSYVPPAVQPALGENQPHRDSRRRRRFGPYPCLRPWLNNHHRAVVRQHPEHLQQHLRNGMFNHCFSAFLISKNQNQPILAQGLPACPCEKAPCGSPFRKAQI